MNRTRAIGIVAVMSILGAAPWCARADWSQMGGPEPPRVSALLYDGAHYLLGSNEADAGETFRSTDGLTWTSAGLPNGGVTLLEMHAGRIFAGTYLTGLWSSSDSGSTWNEITSGLPFNSVVGGMASLGGALFVAFNDFGGQQIYRSVDGGANWSAIPGSPVVSCASMGAFGANIILGLDGGGILRSTDGGTTWSPANAGIPANSKVRAITTQSGTVFAGVSVPSNPSSTGVYASANGGSNWTRVSTDLSGNGLTTIEDLISAGGPLYAALVRGPSQGVYRSTNGGVNWTLSSSGLPSGTGAQSLLYDGSTLFCGTGLGAFRSSNGGGTWTRTDAGASAIRGTTSLLADGGTLLVGLATNGGLGRGIWRTTDRGTTWLGDPSIPDQNTATNGIARLGGSLYAGVDGLSRGIFRSTDNGASWQNSSSGLSPSTVVRDVHAHQGVLLAGAWEALYRSTNAGASWAAVPGISNVSCFASSGSDVYAGLYGSGVIRSTDGGASWSQVNGGLAGDAARTVNALAFHEGALYLGSNGAGVLRLDGSTWVGAGLPGEYVNALVSVNGVLVAGLALDVKLQATTDGGDHWGPIDAGYAGGEVYGLVADPQFLIVGTRGFGIWILPLAELPGSAGVGGATPSRFSMSGGPNPFGDGATIRYVLPEAADVDMRLIDPSGREVAAIAATHQTPGPHEAFFEASRLPAGAYFVRMRSGGRTEGLRMIHVPR